MSEWLRWVGKLVLQPPPEQDERVTQIAAEVDSLRDVTSELKKRTAALEAIHQLAGRKRQ
jgi:hypothetical protein